MPVWGIILIAVGAFVIVSAVVMFIITWRITKAVLYDQLVRTSPEKWGRECSCPENAEHLDMFEQGLRWGEQNSAARHEVDIVNDGLHLYGEYFDFGYDKCAFIHQGRAESLLYGYYFAPAYQNIGYNILVVDTRANGKSDGDHVGVGILESSDITAWINHITDKFGVKDFVIHGICIGSAAAILAAGQKDFPSCVKAIVAEGTYQSFYESFREHMKDAGHKTFPVLQESWLMCRLYWGIDILKDSPIKNIGKVRVPLLMLCGKCDLYSLPEKSRELFDKCSVSPKRLVWFDKGAHSHLRINAVEKYDAEIKSFLDTL